MFSFGGEGWGGGEKTNNNLALLLTEMLYILLFK